MPRPMRERHGPARNWWLWMPYPEYVAYELGDGVHVVHRHSLTGRVVAEVTIPGEKWGRMTPAERSEYAMSHLRKIEEQREGEAAGMPGIDPAFQEKYPALFDYLTLVVDDQGKVRRTSTITLSVDDGVWKANLNDRQTGYQLFMTADTFAGAIEALEAVLHAPKAPWRRNPWSQGPPGKKRS